ncbi:aromatic amino acid hydroxylase [Pseudohalioglobus sediminis]|uniref:Aromatic amino acid hydroxylase n=1 Tax=Pseudohalioglobus sediminis TaxID=2606449 RepID=A0A5B0X3J1_9GAMM|nr:aromatic amino acid hydroxylase [Pseudohalioglobus sediminis]KAA1193944.1 aromatic amino acid hydroxylase [Pseudohalioglobus sediminis]
MTQEEILDSLPSHLRPFVKTQRYEDYTPRDQAVWRFVMKHLTRQLADTAHPVYLEGLRRTGIALDHIPSIEEMNDCLAELGWRAVVVDGFIPPAIFMEFQALRVLVIALDMRSVDHIFYTPAPDIVHESAGHAPFIIDIDYAEFLQRFGEVGMKAIATREDLEQYEAIRKLSILKECPDSTPDSIAAAEAELERLAVADNASPSEAALLTRLHWWTVEYGLVGDPEEYRIFGAGLLSSLGESTHCLDDARVRKLPLTVDAVLTPYDITREQPQLFVTKSCKHLSQVLEEFAESMCYRKGGAASLRTAIAAGSICTARYDSGMQVSGQFCEVLCDAVGNATYLRTSGPTQLAFKDTEIYGHGVDYHAEGFGSPIGHLKDFSRCLSEYTIDELKAHAIEIGKRVRLEYLSGITVDGVLKTVFRQDNRNLVLSFEDCRVSDLSGRVLFDPAWGSYDLAVGSAVTSVYGGVADREKLQLYKPTPRTETIRAVHNTQLMDCYTLVARLAAAGAAAGDDARDTLLAILEQHPDEWLLLSEMLAVADAPLHERIRTQLRNLGTRRPEIAGLIDLALAG